MTNAATLVAYAGTMRHLVDGLDVVGDDIEEMARRLRKLPRKGQNAKSLHSELGIHRFRGETISLRLGRPSESNRIVLLHKIEHARHYQETARHYQETVISVSVDGDVVVRTPFPEHQWAAMPDVAREGFAGRSLGTLIDMSATSVPELGDCHIKSIYHQRSLSSQDPAALVAYVKAPVTTYLASAMKNLRR